MRLYDSFVRSVLTDGVKERYLIWCLRQDYNTPEHSVMWETRRHPMSKGTSKRAMKFEVKMTRCKKGSIRMLEKVSRRERT